MGYTITNNITSIVQTWRHLHPKYGKLHGENHDSPWDGMEYPVFRQPPWEFTRLAYGGDS
jgi:hypothetical protein